MRTTTVLLTAALSLVGAATTFAQVYSVNTVGYVNLTLKKGFNMIGNPLDNKTGNTVGNLFGTALPDGSTVYKFKNGAYAPNNDYTSLFGWGDAAQTLAPGEGAFVLLPSDGPATATVTFVGDVMQGHLVNTLVKGFNMVASMVPQAGKLQADLGYVPGDGDEVYQYVAGTGYAPTVSYTALFGWDPGDPTIAVGEAFWLKTGAAGSWVRDFTVK